MELNILNLVMLAADGSGFSDSLGINAMDEFLRGLIEHMNKQSSLNISLVGLARAVGSLLCLVVGSYECYMMMLGRRGIDVMKIARIIGISLCIFFSGSICSMLEFPIAEIETSAKAFADKEYADVRNKEITVANLSKQYADAIKNQAVTSKQQVDVSNDDKKESTSFLDIDEAIANAKKYMMSWAVSLETWFLEWVNTIIRWIGMIIFQCAFYAIILGSICFKALLKIWAPMAFALSLAPPFKSAWSQWMSKFLSICLWGFVAYFVLGYVWMIVEYTLDRDIKAYGTLIGQLDLTEMDWAQVGSLGIHQIGSTCMYVVGLLIGAALMGFVPEVSSWLIPGGVSSGFGGMANSAVTGASTSVGSAAVGAGGAYVSNVYSNGKTQISQNIKDNWGHSQSDPKLPNT